MVSRTEAAVPVDHASFSIEHGIKRAQAEIVGSTKRQKLSLEEAIRPLIALHEIPRLPILGQEEATPSHLRVFLYEDEETAAEVLLDPQGRLLSVPTEQGKYRLADASELPPQSYLSLVPLAFRALEFHATDDLSQAYIGDLAFWAAEETTVVASQLKDSMRDAFKSLKSAGIITEQEVRLRDTDGAAVIDTANFFEVLPFFEDTDVAAPGLLLMENGSLVWAYKQGKRYDLTDIEALPLERYPEHAEDALRKMLKDAKRAEVSQAIAEGKYHNAIRKMLQSDSRLVRSTMELLSKEGKLERVSDDKANLSEDGKPTNLETALHGISFLVPGMAKSVKQYQMAVLGTQFSHDVETSIATLLIQAKKPTEVYNGEQLHFNLHVTQTSGEGVVTGRGVHFTETGQIICVTNQIGEESDVIEVFQKDDQGEFVVSDANQEKASSQVGSIIEAAIWTQRKSK